MCTASCCGVAFAAGPDAIRWPGSDHSDALAARDEVRSVPVFCRSVVITSLALAPLVLVLSAVRHRPGSGGGAFGPALRSEVRRVGQAFVSTCLSWWSTYL